MEKSIDVLVTGANGQLGLTLKELSTHAHDINWHFYDSKSLDITDKKRLENVIDGNTDVIINCAAYTNVEQAEDEKEKALTVNCQGVKNIVDAIKGTATILIHISTDYVFDGKKSESYNEEDETNPINFYGESKLAGELEIIKNLHNYYIIRTSWLYSKFKKNFYSTVKNKMRAGEKMTITDSQYGSPTSTIDLALAIMTVIKSDDNHFGVYHFSNSGKTSWYNFARQIVANLNDSDIFSLITIGEYQTKAKRPINSKLRTKKFENVFDYKISTWQNALLQVMHSSDNNL